MPKKWQQFYQFYYFVICAGPFDTRSRASFLPTSLGSCVLCLRTLTPSSGPKPSPRLLLLTCQVAAAPPGARAGQGFCTLVMNNQGTQLGAWQKRSGWRWGDGVGTHLHAPFGAARALAEGSGQPGPPQPQTGPHGPHRLRLPENK